MPFHSPSQIVATLRKLGKQKAQLSVGKLLLLSFFAGAYIAFGGLLAVRIGGGVPALKAENPGLQMLLFGAVFPVGLMLVVMAGAELFTGNTAIMEWSVFEGMRTLSANIAVEMPESAIGSSHYRVLFLAAFVLFVFTFFFNTIAEVVRQRLRDRYSSL